ncbi:MAG: prepilin peptidase [Coriobacteriales bacterium]|jgi:leader peptidase (prepilin peptidase)/N-methyltransferase|nr:prepilin peptidase [Coriobacteriales bacterium]
MQIALDIVSYGVVFAFGITIGSFLNVLIYRIPHKLDFVRGRSFCPNCEHRLGPADLVPIFSYLALGRKCRYCKKPISPRYMIVELIGGLLAVGAWATFLANPPLLIANPWLVGNTAPPLAAVLFFLVLCILLTISFIDADTMEIPDGLVIALLVCGVLAIVVGPEVTLLSRGIGLFAVSVPLLVLTLVIPNAFGGGDIKLMAAAGLLLGWQGVLVAFFIGIVLGGVYGVFLLATRKKDGKGLFAFGPALCVGIAGALFFGKLIADWYLGFF